MDSNIVFRISKDTIIISEMKKEVDYKSLNNTNIIDMKELKFSTTYIRENLDLVANFLNVVIIKKNVTTVQINNFEIIKISIDLINEWNHIKKIIFKPDKKLKMDIFMKLLDNKYIEEINCYEMPNYLIERLDVNKNIKVITRHKYDYNSKFMIVNSLNSYSDIYYKKLIILSGDFDLEDLDDFKMFIKMNDKLRTIKIVNYSNEILTSVIKEIVENNKANITIEINEKNNDLNTIYNTVTYIKKIYRKYFEEFNINFKLNYSNEYKYKNFFKEINFKLFTAIIIFVIVISSIIIGINYYQQYLDVNKIENVMIDIENIYNEADEYIDIDNNDSDVEYIDTLDEQTTTKRAGGGGSSSAYYTNFNQVFDELIKKNNDTVGWIKINNTKINYPVVKSDVNSYYLNHDFYKKKNSMGWIFMDYRNNPVDLDRNTIIYGHNIKQGIMFGTIKNMMNSAWYKKTDNQVFSFNTPTKNMKWKIFSLYQIKETDDYLKTEFANDEEYMNFLNMLKNRSKNNFNVELTPESKIITLSTCFSTGTRHVVHAVLVEEENTNPPQG